ncbi:hypothetical protein G3N95_15815 [Paraburkholderia sp. Tr-20389]|uniref:hypothetical protein n=1 Tax=Paraburkholderia sp. Tr-20389 TaxID=2703903 RepID=UPI00198004F9|nr:hypothetical protein [Paraburkholderia sp. Tr-20389]MBN3754416.1 hypothetical protein [Paraburkholderia sp. Tr-20389]
MKFSLASTLATAAAAALALTGTAAMAATPGSGDNLSCAIGYVTGVGGAADSMREYLATPDRDRYRYVADHPIQCKVSDDGRATGCTGLDNLRHEKVSVYDEIDSATISVVARIELEHGQTYPAIIVVQKKDVRCDD